VRERPGGAGEIGVAPGRCDQRRGSASLGAGREPFVRRLDGELVKSARLEVEIAPPEGRPMSFKPTVLAARPGRSAGSGTS
jgi:hypothetical protein